MSLARYIVGGDSLGGAVSLVAIGSQLWPYVIRGARDRNDVFQRVVEVASKMVDGVDSRTRAEQYGIREDADIKSELREVILFAVDWADGAFPKIVTTHKYAAALMCTKCGPETADDLILPWRAFIVHVPNGLLVAGDKDYSTIRVHDTRTPIADGRSVVMSIGVEAGREVQVCMTHADLFSPDGEVEGTGDVTNEEERITRLARRLVAGLLTTMQHTNNFRVRGPTKPGTTKRDGEPEHRVVFVGRPISVDCRPGVAAYVNGSGRGGPPSVQVLVRGHYKRQVIGISRGGRKVIWIEPYWRGPEDAPILSHPYRVGPALQQGQES